MRYLIPVNSITDYIIDNETYLCLGSNSAIFLSGFEAKSYVNELLNVAPDTSYRQAVLPFVMNVYLEYVFLLVIRSGLSAIWYDGVGFICKGRVKIISLRPLKVGNNGVYYQEGYADFYRRVVLELV